MTGSGFTYFAVFGAMRTGSNLLERTLNQYPGVRCHGELFNPNFIGAANSDAFRGIGIGERDRNPTKIISSLADRKGDCIEGFRIFQGHDQRVLDHCTRDPKCAKIILRRSSVDSYVSLKIAKRTDQWVLGGIAKRKSAIVEFVPDEYESFIRDRESFYVSVERDIQISGQSAFELSFDDLKSVEILNGLARFLGKPTELSSLKEPIKRQNPEPLHEKIQNFEEMRDYLAGRTEISDIGDRALVSSGDGTIRDVVVCTQPNLIYVPLAGNHRQDVVNELAQRDDHATDLSEGEFNTWLKFHPDHVSFSIVEHPLERIYSVFRRRLIDGPGKFRNIQKRLIANFGLRLDDTGNLKALREDFSAFLEFILANLSGQTAVRVAADWQLQSHHIQAMSRVVPIRRIYRPSDLTDMSRETGLSGDHIRKKHQTELSEIYSDRLEKLAHKIYARDYRLLGFDRWNPRDGNHAA